MLLKEFSTIFDRPEKVKKLREYILSLAVRGKLVEQDENDEPASVLLERIREEKERLVKEKKIKKEKPLPEISEDEIPYELPKGWEWVRFKDITICRDGERIAVSKSEREKREKIYDYYGASGVIDKIDSYLFDKPLLLIGEDGANLITRSKPIAFIAEGKYWVNNHAHVLDSIEYITLRYIAIYINSIDLKPYVTGTAQPKMNQAKLNSIPVIVPPLNEQKRIVEKVDYLMEFCDKLEEQLDKQVKYGSLSAKSVLNGVSNCSSYEELEEALRFIIENFKDLTLADGAVGELKNAILSLAVKGKLVPQDESDEPASVLIDRIREEKDRLVKEKKIKKDKPLPEISEDEIPYELPKGWEWTRLGDIVSILGDGLHGTPTYSDTGEYYFVNGNNLNEGKIEIKANTKKVALTEFEKYKKPLDESTMFISINGTLGNLAFYNNEKIVLGKSACYFNLLNDINKMYMFWMLKSGYVVAYLNNMATGTTIKNVSLKSMRLLSIPLPPLNEQKRIVEKVDRLMKVCDELELRIEQSKKYNEKLMESILKESFKA